MAEQAFERPNCVCWKNIIEKATIYLFKGDLKEFASQNGYILENTILFIKI